MVLDELLAASAALHQHLCPRQVLGVRMGLLAGQQLQIDLPQTDKRLLTIVETDGCATDGIAVATNCWVGRRTLKVMDFGKVAGTFVDTYTGQAIRIVPQRHVRQLAQAFAPDARTPWEGYLLGYQRMPAMDLLNVQAVQLMQPVQHILGLPGAKAQCHSCSEEIMNEREVYHEGKMLCRTCAGEGYYHVLPMNNEEIVRIPMTVG
jgi:formylmethanofuran dehydrogenase subunit E